MAGRASPSSFFTASQYAIRERRLLIAHRAHAARRSRSAAACQPGTGTAQQRGIRRHSAAWRAPPRGRALPMMGRRGDARVIRKVVDFPTTRARGTEALLSCRVQSDQATLRTHYHWQKGAHAPRVLQGCSCTSASVALDARTHGGALTPRPVGHRRARRAHAAGA